MQFTDLTKCQPLGPEDAKTVLLAAMRLLRNALEYTAHEPRYSSAALCLGLVLLNRMAGIPRSLVHEQLDVTWANVDANPFLRDTVSSGNRFFVVPPGNDELS